MAAQPPAAVLSARDTIQFTIRILRSYGIDNLTPETIRQAKFNAPAAGAPLLKALHDLALCMAAGLPRGCGAGIAALSQQLAQELVDADATTPEGTLLLLHWLSSWGCPAGLVTQLAAASPPTISSSDESANSSSSSRLCLLALAWLIGHARLFERALDHLQLPQQLLPLLPPYPEDTRQTAAAQARCSAAVATAQQHAQRVQRQLQTLAAAAPTGERGSCWPAVQAATQHVLSTFRAATLRLQLLTSLQEGREKLLDQIQQQQQQQQQQDASSRGGSGSKASSSQPGTKAAAAAAAGGQARAKHPPLTAFELHLLSRPQLLQQHEDAVLQACSLLQQQLQCVQAATTFFAWAGSVLQEEQKAAAAGRGGSSGSHLAGQCLPDLAEVVPLVQQLPAADSPQAAAVLQRVAKQLQQAAAAAGFDAGPSNGFASSSRDAATAVAQLAGLSLQAVGPGAATAADTAALEPFSRLAAAAMGEAGIAPSGEQQLRQLPDDIQQQLAAVVREEQQRRQQQQEQPSRAWHRLVLPPEQMSALHARWHHQQKQHGQQQQQPEDAATTDALSLADALLKPVSAQRPGQLVPVAAELHRLQAQAMQVARQLAKTRASNRQQLQAAEEALTAAAGARGEQLVFVKS